MIRPLSAAFVLTLLAAPAYAQEPAPASESILDAEESGLEADDPDAAETPPSQVPLAQIKRYVAVFRTVKQAYVDPIGDEKLMQAAIRGLLLDLDPHSAYLDKDASAQLDEQSSGAYDGVGLELIQQPDRSLRVIAPIDDTPADRAGIKAGDVITAIDGKPIDADGVNGAADTLRGAPGTTVTLSIFREGAPTPLRITIKRETIRILSVRERMLEPGYGYVRISTFQADTGAELTKRTKALVAKSDGRLKGLVLDLRSNPGGLLNAAVEAADTFLDAGTIVSTKGRISIADSEFHATPGDVLDGAPIVVLVDAGSASAAEVLAGALRDRKRALVMGARTFGKGSVQTVLPLDNGDAIKLTTARYYTPNGESIQAAGIAPEVVLHPQNKGADNGATSGLRESDLPNHLRGDQEADDGRYALGEILEGESYVQQALARLKTMTGQPPPPAKTATARLRPEGSTATADH